MQTIRCFSRAALSVFQCEIEKTENREKIPRTLRIFEGRVLDGLASVEKGSKGRN